MNRTHGAGSLCDGSRYPLHETVANVAQEHIGSEGVNYLLGLGLDQRYARKDSSGSRSYLTDALGSTIALANSSGETTTTYSYDPLGQTKADGEASPNPYQYTGRENDGTALQYNRERYYSPGEQRFISHDPLGFAGRGNEPLCIHGRQPDRPSRPDWHDSRWARNLRLCALRCSVAGTS